MNSKNAARKNHRKIKLTILITFISFASLFLVSCTKEEKGETIPLVKTMTVGVESSFNTLTYTGDVKADKEIYLSFQVPGKIKARYVDIGSHVEKGDVLFALDEEDIIAKLKKAQAGEEMARADFLLAKKNLQRYEELYQEGAIPALKLDQARFNVDAKKALLENNTSNLTEAQNALSYTLLRAEIAGRIGKIDAEIGQIVAPARPIALLIDDKNLEVETHIPEKDLAFLKTGQKVTLNFWALQNEKGEGSIKEISPLADPLAKTYKVLITIVNPPKKLQRGMTVKITLKNETKKQQGIYLPTSAILKTDADPFVFKVTGEDMVEKIPIKTLDIFENKILVEGLQKGDIIVTKGVHKLHAGDKVRILMEEEK